ncbi:MAG: hypothetical protein HQL08_09730 [Nitrospirae bacterium]|nr:hypothetical protein [Nitrospirota bacterium]
MKKKFAAVFCFALVAAFTTACKGNRNEGFVPSKVVQVEAGNVDFIGPVKAPLNTPIRTYGWAAELQAGNVTNVLVVVCDGKQVPATLKMSGSRPDVAKNFLNDNFEKTGWEGVVPASSLGIGKHKVEFYALLSDNTFAPLHCGAFKYCEVEVIN